MARADAPDYAALLIAAACWMLIRLAPALMVLLVALMIVGSLSPAVRALHARGIGRRSAILIVFDVQGDLVFLAADVQAPGLVHRLERQLGRVTGP